MRVLFVMLVTFFMPALPALARCPSEGALPLVEQTGMTWAITGSEPKALDPGSARAWASAWRNASNAAGMSLIVLSGLASDVTSWGAVQKSKGSGVGRYDFSVLDVIVEAFEGQAVLVLSSRCAWDHTDGIKPSNHTAFRDYVKAVVKRYDGDDDFGIADGSDPSYPDIDGSGKTTIADSETPKEEKLKWASAHRVAAYMLETTSTPEGAAITDYAELAKEAMMAVLGASNTAELWLAPFSAAMPRSEWQARFGSLTLPAGSKGRVAALVEVPNASSDFTGATVAETLSKVAKWYQDAGLADIGLILGGVSLGVRKGAAGCPDSRCGPAMQAEQAVKITALAAATGAKAVAFAGVVESASTPTGSGFVIVEYTGGSAKITTRPIGDVLNTLRPALAGDGTATRIATGQPPVPSTSAVRSRSCEAETDFIAWYDWTDEVGPDAPYSDLMKKIQIPASAETLDVMVLDGSGSKLQVEPGPDGVAYVLIGRSPVLATAGLAVADDHPDVTEAADDIETLPETTPGGGCATGYAASPMALVLALLLRRRW